MLKKIALLTTALTALAPAALAADLPRKSAPIAPLMMPSFTWTGFTVGAHAGYSFAGSDTVDTVGNNAITIANVANNFRPGFLKVEREGFVGGAQVGYNYQIGRVVLGLEADISYVDTDSNTTFTSTRGDISIYRQQLDYLGTVRGRLGVAFDRILVYGTGGLAYGNVKQGADFLALGSNALQFTGQREDTRTGFAAGGGVEYAITNNITLRAEYLYYDLGKENVVIAGVAGAPNISPLNISGYNANFETNGHIARAAINFKFGG